MAVRWYKVQTTVYPVVLNVFPIQAALVRKILAELLVDVSRAGLPRVLAIYRIAESFNDT